MGGLFRMKNILIFLWCVVVCSFAIKIISILWYILWNIFTKDNGTDITESIQKIWDD